MQEHSQRYRRGAFRPFLRWAGGKRVLAPQILATLGPGRRLIEPFVGAGAVFAAAQHATFVLGDCNPDLVDVYTALKLRPTEFITACRELFTRPVSRDAYLLIRQEFNQSSGLGRAVRFLYLNCYAFNGLCRYNRAGQFNVPYGGDVQRFLAEDLLWNWSEKLERADLVCGDFETTLSRAVSGDVVYCDPPYLPLPGKRCFTAYAPAGFDPADHVRLALRAREIAGRGVTVAISNHDSPLARQLYADSEIIELEVARHLSARAQSRRPAKEILAVYSDSKWPE